MKLTDANKIRDYVKEQINPYGKPFEGSVYDFGLKIMNYIDNMSASYDIDGVIEELEKKKGTYFDGITCEGTKIKINEAIEIVKQGCTPDDCCEWIEYDYRTMCPKNHDTKNPYWRIPVYMDKLKYCPYCGKKIKVVE